MSFKDRVSKKSTELTPDELTKLMKLAYELKNAMEVGDKTKLDFLSTMRPLLLVMLEYLILNMDKPELDISLIPLLAKFLGIELSKEKEDEFEKAEEERLSEEEKKRRHRLVVYEIYKMMNPRQIAGETKLDNFINNVKTKGIKTAMLYEGSEYSKYFKKEDIKALEALGSEFKDILSKAGITYTAGQGRG